MGRYVIGITGASGSIYAARLIQHLKSLGHDVWTVCTDAGTQVAKYENQIDGLKFADKQFSINDFFAPISSGSYDYQGMVVVPCSMGTLGKMAHGIGDNLLTRAADVCLKEKRPLIVVPRETPFSSIHLENMLALTRAGAMMIAASPHFYHHPKSIDDLVDTVLARVLDHLGVEHQISPRWREET